MTRGFEAKGANPSLFAATVLCPQYGRQSKGTPGDWVEATRGHCGSVGGRAQALSDGLQDAVDSHRDLSPLQPRTRAHTHRDTRSCVSHGSGLHVSGLQDHHGMRPHGESTGILRLRGFGNGGGMGMGPPVLYTHNQAALGRTPPPTRSRRGLLCACAGLRQPGRRGGHHPARQGRGHRRGRVGRRTCRSALSL